jgi:hypothetical protein
MHRGDFIYGEYGQPAQWSPSEAGAAHLWCSLIDGKPPGDKRIIVGVDIAGSGSATSSNSVIQAIDRDTGEQVLEWACGSFHPTDFAQLVVSVCRWIADDEPYLLWEANGPGGDFREEIKNLQYHNCYRRQRRWDRNLASKKRSKAQQEMGIVVKTKSTLLEPIRVALKIGDICPHSQLLIDELPEFRYIGEDVAHYRSVHKDTDEGSKRGLHGDRVTAFGCAVWGFNEFRRPRTSQRKKPPETRTALPGSLAYRMKQYALKESERTFIF